MIHMSKLYAILDTYVNQVQSNSGSTIFRNTADELTEVSKSSCLNEETDGLVLGEFSWMTTKTPLRYFLLQTKT